MYFVEQHNGLTGAAARWVRASTRLFETRGDALLHAEGLHSTPETPLRVVPAHPGPSDAQLRAWEADLPGEVGPAGWDGNGGWAW